MSQPLRVTDVPTMVASGADRLAAGPPAFAAYVQSGAPMPTWRRDLGTAFNQIPRWAYGAAAVIALLLAYRAWRGVGKSPAGAT